MDDFWMDEDAPSLGGGGLSQLSQASTSGAVGDDAFVCEECGGTECYRDDTTGHDICAGCYTQSQPHQQQPEADTMEYEEVMAAAARTRGGVLLQRRNKKKTDRRGPARKPNSDFDTSQPLPSLADCLEGMRVVLQGCLNILDKTLHNHLDKSKRQQLRNDRKQMAKHLLLSFVQAWGEAAKHYQAIYPQVRFCLRDLFLPPPYRRAVHATLLDQTCQRVLQVKKEEDDGSNSSSSSDENETLKQEEEEGVKYEPFVKKKRKSPDPTERSNKKPTHKRGKADNTKKEDGENDDRKEKGEKDQGNLKVDEDDDDGESDNEEEEGVGAKQTHSKLFRRIAERGGSNAKGRMEAALVLQPGMDMVASILWLTVVRQGIPSCQILEWILNGVLPLHNAFSQLLSKDLQTRLRPVRVSFQQQRWFPTTHAMERNASLLLLCCTGLQSLQDFAGASHYGKYDRNRVRTLAAAAIPVTTARFVADLGLPQHICDVALSLMGAIPRVSGLPKQMARLSVESIQTHSHVVAVILCAILVQQDWRDYLVIARRPGGQATIPWTEDQFRQLTTGASLDHYLDFCDDLFVDCKRKSKVDNLHTSVCTSSVSHEHQKQEEGEDKTDDDEGDDDVSDADETSLSKDKDADDTKKASHPPSTKTIRACPIVAGVSVEGISSRRTEQTATFLQKRIAYCTRKKKFMWSESANGTCPHLCAEEMLLLEFLAYTTRIQTTQLLRALTEVLNLNEM